VIQTTDNRLQSIAGIRCRTGIIDYLRLRM
jgi:hypothetical protein